MVQWVRQPQVTPDVFQGIDYDVEELAAAGWEAAAIQRPKVAAAIAAGDGEAAWASLSISRRLASKTRSRTGW